MLTKVAIRNFKRFDEVEVEFGNPVLFVGPNDAGKTSALRALMLWDLGLRRWTEKRGGKTAGAANAAQTARLSIVVDGEDREVVVAAMPLKTRRTV